jgi:hypothetical protein
VAEQIELFISPAESELIIQTQDVMLQIDEQAIDLAIENVNQELVIENPIYEVVVSSAEPESSLEIYEPWDKQGILNAFNSIKNQMMQTTADLHVYEQITEESLNRHKNNIDAKLNTLLSFMSYLINEITK